MYRHQKTLAATTSLAAALALAGAARADPIAFNQTPLSNVVAQLNKQYGISIVLKGSLAQNPDQPVTFSLGDSGTTPTRLQAVNALANAAGVDFQKGYVVSKIASDEAPPVPRIDSNGFVVFKTATVAAADAITAVATTDNATVQVSPDVTGDVTFTATTLRTAVAAREIARQTHTGWRVYYALTPRSMGQRGKVVDHNSGGQPITQLPFTYYGTKSRPDPTPAAVPSTINPDAASTVPPVGGTAPVASATAPGTGVNVVPTAPYGYAPTFTYGTTYGYTPYGAGPYPMQYGGFDNGYGGYGGYSGGYGGYPGGGYGGYPGGGYGGGGINVLPGSGNYGPFGGYGGAPVTIGGYGYGY